MSLLKIVQLLLKLVYVDLFPDHKVHIAVSFKSVHIK